MGTNSESVYITRTTCRGITEPKTAKISRISAKMKQKSPLFPGYRRRQSKNSEKARSTGNPLGRRGGRAASLLDSVEDGRNLFALVRLLGSQTTTGDNRCRVTSAQERPRVGRFLRPARNQFFFRKSDFTQAGAARAKKLTHPKPREKKKTEGQKISGRGSKFEGAQNLRGEGLKI